MRALPATVAALILASCAGTAPASRAAAPAAPSGTTVEITGTLALKGPAETASFTITEPSGRTWQLVEVPPALEARLRALQHRQVTLRVEPLGKLLVEQARPVDVSSPAP